MTRKTRSFVSIIAVLVAITVTPAIASVEFDGMTWYHSHTDPNYNISINGDGHLEWIPKNDHQIIVRIPDQNLSEVGDVVEISYWWLSDGQGNIEGCIDCCQCEDTCNKNKDITCVSGTGDFRIGLFESDGEYITSDGMGLENSIFAGYKGYKFCTQPHVDIEPVRWQEASGEPHIAGGFYQRDEVDNPKLLSINRVFNRISMYGGFELPLDKWSLWTIRLERLSAGSIEMSITLNGITYTDIDDTNTPEVPQPNKINVFAIDFANPNPFDKIVLATIDSFPPADFNKDQSVNEYDLLMLADDWLDSEVQLPQQPDANSIVLKYSFDGTIDTNVPTALGDDTGTYTAVTISGSDTNSTIKYFVPCPDANGSTTSAGFSNIDWSNNAGDTFIIPDANGLDFSLFGEFTFQFFINPSSTGANQSRRLFSEYVNLYMNLDSENTLHARRKWGPGAWNENSTHLSVPNFPHDTWSHVALTWDSAAAGNKLKLYINGILEADTLGTSLPTLDSTAGFAIGGYQRENGSTAQFFDGMIDDFSMYNYALSNTEIVYLIADSYVFEVATDLNNDKTINFKDYADFAWQWLNYN